MPEEHKVSVRLREFPPNTARLYKEVCLASQPNQLGDSLTAGRRAPIPEIQVRILFAQPTQENQ